MLTRARAIREHPGTVARTEDQDPVSVFAVVLAEEFAREIAKGNDCGLSVDDTVDQHPVSVLAAVLTALWRAARAEVSPDALHRAIAAARSIAWTLPRYAEAFAATPELLELTTTPFMTQIVITIMPDLQQHTTTPASAKSELILRTSEAAAEPAWAQLRAKKLCRTLDELQATGRKVEAGDPDLASDFHEVAARVVEHAGRRRQPGRAQAGHAGA